MTDHIQSTIRPEHGGGSFVPRWRDSFISVVGEAILRVKGFKGQSYTRDQCSVCIPHNDHLPSRILHVAIRAGHGGGPSISCTVVGFNVRIISYVGACCVFR